MKSAAVAVFAAATVAASRQHFDTLVNNAGIAPKAAYSFFADIREKRGGKTVCGGTLVKSPNGGADEWVLTAARCFDNVRNPQNLVITLGGGARADNPMYNIESVQAHPLYDANTHAYDIALVKLVKPAAKAFKGLGVVGASEAPRAGSKVTYVGYGDRYRDGGVASDLLHTGEPTGHDYKVLGPSHNQCAKHYENLGLVYPECSALCVKQLTPGGPCDGDVGGPNLVQDQDSGAWAVVGVTSSTGGCGEQNKVNMVTSLVGSNEWLQCVSTNQNNCAAIGQNADRDVCRAPGSSTSSCAQLGWSVKAGSSTCGASFVMPAPGKMQCAFASTYAEAEAMCSNQGARLCRVEELNTNVAAGSGCGLDGKRVWTRDPCGFKRQGEMLTAGGSSGMKSRCSATSDLHGVRCCADTQLEEVAAETTVVTAPSKATVSGSTLSCAQLGWVKGKGNSEVCAQSRFPLGDFDKQGCPRNMMAAQAAAFCSEQGARLCTSAELLNNEAQGTGCNLDGARTWTSDVCTTGAISQAGAYDSIISFPKKCTVTTEKFAPRCCADTKSSDQINMLSWYSCKELNWPLKGNNDVCASSLTGYGCSLTMPHADAALKCADAGGRLCSDAELYNDVAKSTGCQLDSRRVWTSVPCEGGFYTTAGSRAFFGRLGRTCTSSDAYNNVRCCADKQPLTIIDDNFPMWRDNLAPKP